MRSEHAWLRRLPKVVGPGSPAVQVGIGDDAAVLGCGPDPLVVTTDACVEGVHFTRAIASPGDVGYRSFMAAASDVAAMAARPLAALSALQLPAGFSDDDLDALVEGQRQAAAAARLPLVGGNLSRGPCLAVTTTVLGQALAPVLRSGARPGQRLWLGGAVGLAAAGLQALLASAPPAPSAAVERCVRAWRRPEARLDLGQALAGRASALIDVSDGLAQDAAHIALASGARLLLDADAAVRSAGPELSEAALALGLDAASLALAGGEDYALLAASDHDLAPLGFIAVGVVEAGEPEVVVLRAGKPWSPPRGFDHGG